jgi:hypothetical protein
VIHTLFSSQFSRFPPPLNPSLSFTRTTFENAIPRPITLTLDTEFNSLDVSARHFAKSNAIFQECRFHALSSLRGDVDETSGGAVFSDGFDLVFKKCSFSGNCAVTGGSCVFLRSNIFCELCNFTNNRATFEAGVIAIESTLLKMSECNFVQNEAELYVGVLKGLNATIKGETLIFHGNRAVFHSSVVDLDNSIAGFTAAQFSGNMVDNEEGGVVHNLKGSKLKLSGCTFETLPKHFLNSSLRQPIRADVTSQVIVKQGCFDTSEDILKYGIEGKYSGSIGTIHSDSCQCSYVVLPQAYNVLEKEIKLEDSLLTTRFLLTAAGLGILALVMVILVVFDGSRTGSAWVAL